MDRSQPNLTPDGRQIYSVGQLNQEVRKLLRENLPLLWIEGELSNLARPASGHLYFSLKDEQAQVRCAMFRNANRLLPFRPENGMHILMNARASLYEPRGEFQLTVEYMEKAGAGILQRKYEKLKQKLSAEGLFDALHKQPLPEFPKILSVITSATGAALHDILSVLRRRYPILEIQVYAVPVQGNKSANAIVDAIQTINQFKSSNIIILARGGGSIEDLWSFNEEIVARAIFASELPIVTGIGHEVDFTIADFVADLRAATPSAAAELVTPHQEELIEAFGQFKRSLSYLTQDYLTTLYQSIDRATQRLKFLNPKQTIQRNKEQLLELTRRALSEIKLKLADQHNQLNRLLIRFKNQSPKSRVHGTKIKFLNTQRDLYHLFQNKLEQRNHQLIELTRTLEAVSPLHTLNRGYAIVTQAKNGQIIRNASQVSPQEKILIQLAKGRLSAYIDKE